MNETFFYLLTLSFIFCLASSEDCPKQCRCYYHGGWYVICNNKNITNEDLVDIAKHLNPIKVKTLSLKENKITDFQAKHFVKFTNLESIYLDGNFINRVPANISLFIPSIKSLSLNTNRLGVVEQKDFEGYHSIEYLYIGENGIENLEPNVFQKLSKLIKLDASGNALKTLKNGTFNNLERLNELNLDDNDIETIETGVQSLIDVSLDRNKLNSVTLATFKDVENACKRSQSHRIKFVYV